MDMVQEWLNSYSGLAEWFSALSTFFAVFVALFGREFIDFIKRPKMKIEFENEQPFVRQALNANLGYRPSSWVRLKIHNEGRTVARNCKVKLAEIRDADNNVINDFDPVTLHWVGGEYDPIDISRDEYEYVDFYYTGETGENVDYFLIYSDRLTLGIKLNYQPGTYFLKVLLYGDNFEPLTKWYRVVWSGRWADINVSEHALSSS